MKALTESPVQVEAFAEVVGDWLQVDYEFRNLGDEVLYLRNQLCDWFGLTGDASLNALLNPKAGATTALGSAEFGGPGEVRIFVGETQVPEGIEMFAPRTPFCTKVEAKKVARATSAAPQCAARATSAAPQCAARARIRLPLPLKEWNAYEPPRDEPTEAELVRRVRLSLEFVAHKNVISAKAHLALRGVFVVRSLKFERVETMCELLGRCTLLRRTDGFARTFESLERA